MTIHSLRNIFFFLTVLVLSGCSKETSSESGIPLKQVLLAYLAVDNSLSSEGMEKVSAFASGSPNEAGYLMLAYLDDRSGSPRLLEILGEGRYRVLRTFPESSSADPAVLGALLSEIRRDYRAESYGMLFFSHATGWLPPGYKIDSSVIGYPRLSSSVRASIGKDGEEEMSLSEFSAAIPDDMFDFVVFEACHMTGIEVCYALRSKTRYILASSAEILSPGYTYVYHGGLRYLIGPHRDLRKFAMAAFEFWNAQSGDMRSSTISIIDIAQMDGFLHWLKGKVDLNSTIDVGNIQSFDRYSGSYYCDLKAGLAALNKDPDFERQLEYWMDRLVLFKQSTDYIYAMNGPRKVLDHSGMTLYLAREGNGLLNEEHSKDFLDNFFLVGSADH